MKRSCRPSFRSGWRPTRSTVSGSSGLRKRSRMAARYAGLLLLGEVVLGDDERRGLAQHPFDGRRDGGVGERVADALVAGEEPEVRGRRVSRVHGEQLALDVRREVVDEVRAGDRGGVVAERRTLDGPLEERLDRHVEAGVGGLAGHDPVDGGVREDRLRRERRPLLGAREGGDLVAQQVGGVDRVLARHDRERRGIRRPFPQGHDEVRCDEPQDGRARRRWWRCRRSAARRGAPRRASGCSRRGSRRRRDRERRRPPRARCSGRMPRARR